jgi:hypothetical protein
MALFEASKTRSENLEKLFRALKSIPPTSVEAERAFSSLGLFANKIRNRLNPETLDALSFLRQYFIKNKSTYKSILYCIHFTADLTTKGLRVNFVKKKPQYRPIPALKFLKYRYYTGPGITFLIPNWKH